MKSKIPSSIIGLLSQVLPDYYTHDGMDGLFLSASAPEDIPEGSKPTKVTTWLRTINKECNNPLTVLGEILEDFMERELYGSYGQFSVENEASIKQARDKISKILAKDGLQYSSGGHISMQGVTSTQSLLEAVKTSGLKAVEIEIKRALDNVEKDPLAAVHNAGCVLEASLKAYLTHHGVEYKDDADTLSDLWKKAVGYIGINPKELENKNLKKIASGLNSVVDGTMHLRNKKGASHGKSEEQFKENNIRPRHARLAIHSAHTVSAYILELLES